MGGWAGKAKQMAFPAGILAGVLVMAWLPDILLGAVPGGIPYTPEHFRSPSVPPSPVAVWQGVSSYFGRGTALMGLAMVAFYAILAVFLWAGFRKRINIAESPRGSAWPEIGFRKLAAGLGAVLAVLLIYRTVVNRPVTVPGNLLHRAGQAVAFPFRFNSALLDKAYFNEDGYREGVFSAFLWDREDFFDFASSRYWATFADTGTRNTTRHLHACNRLKKLAEEGVLAERSSEEGLEFCRSRGHSARAYEMATILYRQYPDNPVVANTIEFYNKGK